MGDVARGQPWRARAPLERRVNGTRVIAAVLGVFVGVSGLDHGLFEALQGSAPTPGLFIHAIGPDQRMWLYGTEDALTLIPNFLVAGIVSIVAGLLTIVWSIWFIDRPRGPTVLLALGALLFLVGGGIAMVVFVVFGWLVARRIGRPIDRWRGIVPTRVATTLASRWPWLVAVSVVLYAIALEIAIFGFVPGVTDPDLVLAVCWSALVAMLLVLVLALIGASAAETDTGPGAGRRGTAAGPRSDDGRTAASTSAGARSRGHGWRALALLSALAIGLGACTAGTEPSGSMRSAAPGSEPAARPSTSGAPPSLAAQACTTDTFRTATDELMAAIGNPDTDAPSEASQAFDDAIASGDPAAIEAAAAVVLQHLAVGHAAIAAGPTGADARIAAACTEWEEMLGDIEEGIALTRDGGVKGSDEDIEVGRALVVGALQDHFWQAVRQRSDDARRVPAGRSHRVGITGAAVHRCWAGVRRQPGHCLDDRRCAAPAVGRD